VAEFAADQMPAAQHLAVDDDAGAGPTSLLSARDIGLAGGDQRVGIGAAAGHDLAPSPRRTETSACASVPSVTAWTW
jgi:hypothetical protein